MKDISSDKLAGLLYGSLIGDALALGPHWIYDQEELRAEFGQVTGFLDPRPGSYHPAKRRGQQTHYGDQALTLMGSIQKRGGFSIEGFASDWQQMWTGYGDYFDHATKETLAHLGAGMPPAEAGSDSKELGGAARIAPLLVAMNTGSVESAVAAARAQTKLTHGTEIAGDAAEFIARLVLALAADADLPTALETAAAGSYAELDLPMMWQAVEARRLLEVPAAAKELGLACPTAQALPTLLLLLDRCGSDLEKALIGNVMVGGDNAARGLALGMILGALHGKSGIPERWINDLAASPSVEAFCSALQR